jgi:hypothetical protein
MQTEKRRQVKNNSGKRRSVSKLSLISALITALCVSLFFLFFQIEKSDVYISPSNEAIRNNYLAFDRWLESLGIEHKKVSLLEIPELPQIQTKNTVLTTSNFSWWGDELTERVLALAGNGYHVWIFIEMYSDLEGVDPFSLLFDELNIEMISDSDVWQGEPVKNRIDFDMSISFAVNNPDAFLHQDTAGIVRAIDIPVGNGRIGISGTPVFLTNPFIGESGNAGFIWSIISDGSNIFAAQNTSGIIVYSSLEQYRPLTLVPDILQREGWLPVLLSLFLFFSVIIIRAAVVPGFIVHQNEIMLSDISRRFLVEGFFHRAYKSDYIYLRYFEQKIIGLLNKQDIQFDKNAEYSLEELSGFISGASGVAREEVFTVLENGRRTSFTNRKFCETIKQYKKILDRL